MLEVKGVSQSYKRDSSLILKNINLRIREKKITALVGANGAGKSTLLGVMASNIKPVSGSVLLDGVDVTKIKTKEIAKKIAFLRQTHHISIKITVNDLVEYGRFPHSGGRLSDACKAAVNSALEYMELTDMRDRFLSEISGGQRQRAFIAMILAQDTPYVFLDEPLNNLDVRFSVDMMKIVQRLVTELGKTVIVVLHDINFAAAYADHIITMKDGEVFAEGSTAEIIAPEVLNDVFDHDFYITYHEGTPVCLCYEREE